MQFTYSLLRMLQYALIVSCHFTVTPYSHHPQRAHQETTIEEKRHLPWYFGTSTSHASSIYIDPSSPVQSCRVHPSKTPVQPPFSIPSQETYYFYKTTWAHEYSQTPNPKASHAGKSNSTSDNKMQAKAVRRRGVTCVIKATQTFMTLSSACEGSASASWMVSSLTPPQCT
jgi:hypothetical protein